VGLPATSGNGRVLVVDDEADMRTLMASLLEESFPGATVMTASTPEQGLDCLERHAVDVVVADFRMPHIDGIEFLLMTAASKPAAGRILVTAYGTPQLRERALAAGITAFLAKGDGPEALIAAVREALASAGMT
jgi:DNA-binding NarL/FixJ family response regulator